MDVNKPSSGLTPTNHSFGNLLIKHGAHQLLTTYCSSAPEDQTFYSSSFQMGVPFLFLLLVGITSVSALQPATNQLVVTIQTNGQVVQPVAHYPSVINYPSAFLRPLPVIASRAIEPHPHVYAVYPVLNQTKPYVAYTRNNITTYFQSHPTETRHILPNSYFSQQSFQPLPRVPITLRTEVVNNTHLRATLAGTNNAQYEIAHDGSGRVVSVRLVHENFLGGSIAQLPVENKVNQIINNVQFINIGADGGIGFLANNGGSGISFALDSYPGALYKNGQINL